MGAGPAGPRWTVDSQKRSTTEQRGKPFALVNTSACPELSRPARTPRFPPIPALRSGVVTHLTCMSSCVTPSDGMFRERAQGEEEKALGCGYAARTHNVGVRWACIRWALSLLSLLTVLQLSGVSCLLDSDSCQEGCCAADASRTSGQDQCPPLCPSCACSVLSHAAAPGLRHAELPARAVPQRERWSPVAVLRPDDAPRAGVFQPPRPV